MIRKGDCSGSRVAAIETIGRVLDLGSGVGANLARIKALGLPYGSYTGVDLTGAMLHQAEARYGAGPDVRFQQVDLMRDALPGGPYDLIVSTWVFEHLPDPVLVAEKAWEQLKPGGHLVLLFEVEAGSWLSRLVDRVYPFFSARLVRNKEVRQFPGVQRDRRFSGPLGDLALVIARK
jgi:SAM-dependent methyltransferase